MDRTSAEPDCARRGSVARDRRRGRRRASPPGIGYWLAPEARGGGRATRAVGLLARWALAQPGIARVEAHVEPGNEASRNLLERLGFRREALLRSYLAFATRRADALVYALLRDEP